MRRSVCFFSSSLVARSLNGGRRNHFFHISLRSTVICGIGVDILMHGYEAGFYLL
jgi:hypothetical protein